MRMRRSVAARSRPLQARGRTAVVDPQERIKPDATFGADELQEPTEFQGLYDPSAVSPSTTAWMLEPRTSRSSAGGGTRRSREVMGLEKGKRIEQRGHLLS